MSKGVNFNYVVRRGHFIQRRASRHFFQRINPPFHKKSGIVRQRGHVWLIPFWRAWETACSCKYDMQPAFPIFNGKQIDGLPHLKLVDSYDRLRQMAGCIAGKYQYADNRRSEHHASHQKHYSFLPPVCCKDQHRGRTGGLSSICGGIKV
jgi:hypothetical protein